MASTCAFANKPSSLVKEVVQLQICSFLACYLLLLYSLTPGFCFWFVQLILSQWHTLMPFVSILSAEAVLIATILVSGIVTVIIS